jgi:superfamily II DNA or RNA helicase
MSYFADRYPVLSFPIATDGGQDGKDRKSGFREAQRGALFAIGAHFTQRDDPAIVTMPTGSGKTAVLQASAFMLQASRVLILTPSRLVREQIAEDFSALGVLKRLTALPDDTTAPKVIATAGRVRTIEQWDAMRAFDVVVATVQSISPHLEEIPEPPTDLFDLILVDEAHHSPALTWKTVIETFPDARKILVTATPFRRDDREIKGSFVYTYSLERAYEDGVFGHVDFEPVAFDESNTDILQADAAIAKAAEARLKADRAEGFDHLLMVRTDSKARARDLVDVYARTSLRLQLVTGDHSLAHVRRVLKKLDNNELDGIICVNMFGEGFDMPRLKVAAIHTPHRSLAVTLQFIGRFARTVGEKLGKATFLAIPSTIEIEARRLYASGAVWAEMIPSMSAARIEREVDLRETLKTFDKTSGVADLGDLSLYGLTPYAHVKIYRLFEAFDFSAKPEFGFDRETVFSWVSETRRASVYITRRAEAVRWASDDRLIDVSFDIFIFYYDEKAKLLFICASKRVDGLYRRIVANLIGYEPRILSVSHINRALKELSDARFHQVGMKKRSVASLNESYRIMAGSRSDEDIRDEDVRLYNRGHCFGSAYDGQDKVTIGLSSSSKIWSNTTYTIPELLEWCGELARKIHDKKAAVTGTKLDRLATGSTVTAIPSAVLFAEWPRHLYLDPPLALYATEEGDQTLPLTDFSLDVVASDNDHVLLKVTNGDFETHLVFRLSDRDALFAYADENQPSLTLTWHRDNVDVVDYLNDDPLAFTLDDWSRLDGEDHFPAQTDGHELYPPALVDTIDWKAEGVDPGIEYADGPKLASSIQGFLARYLDRDEFEIVYWDHGAGETADFVAFKRREDGGIDVKLYHCKGSSGAEPGNRVGDVYEVCGQAVKCVIFCDLPRMVGRLAGRFSRKSGMAQFIKGDIDQLKALSRTRPFTFQMIVVQPGISQMNIESKLSEVLGAANAHLASAGMLEMRTLGSA